MGEFDVPLYAGIGTVAFCSICVACWASFYISRRRRDHEPPPLCDIEAAPSVLPASSMPERAAPPPYPRREFKFKSAYRSVRSGFSKKGHIIGLPSRAIRKNITKPATSDPPTP